MHLLIIEDEKILCNDIAKQLRSCGYEVTTCYDGKTGYELCLSETYALIILDLNLPEIDGLEILKELRKTDMETKVLILSARSQIADKVKGLDYGANDYLIKPFHFDELEARIRSLTRRNFIQNQTLLTCDLLTFDQKSRITKANQTPINLTRKETGILEYLMLNQGRPISQEELIAHVWDGSVDPFSNSIRVHISSLRKKLRNELQYDPISNRIGEGYFLGEHTNEK